MSAASNISAASNELFFYQSPVQVKITLYYKQI